MKMKKKMLLDTVMSIVMVVLFFYTWTGGLIHEILGMILLLGFLVHVIGNRYYVKLVKNQERWKNWKNILSLLLNILLAIGILVMAVSSICISRDLFYLINGKFGNYAFWRMLHVTCAYSMMTIVFAHVLLHWKLITGFLNKHIFGGLSIPVFVNRVFRVLALILAVMILKVSLDNVKNSANIFAMQIAHAKKENVEQVQNTELSKEKEKEIDTSIEAVEETTTENEVVIEEVPEVEKEPLEEYLGRLFCSGCGRHCCLLAPSCGQGQAQAEVATEEYNAMGN